jgi:hypothetical protein
MTGSPLPGPRPGSGKRRRHTKMWPQLALVIVFVVSCDGFHINNALPRAKSLGLRVEASRHSCRQLLTMQSNRKDGATEEQIKNAYGTYEELMSTKNYGKGYWMDSPFQFFFNIQQAFNRNFGSESRANPLDFMKNEPRVVDLSNSPFKPLVSPDDEADEAPQPKQKLPSEPMKPAEPAAKSKSKSLKKSSKAVETGASSTPPAPSAANVRFPALDRNHLRCCI